MKVFLRFTRHPVDDVRSAHLKEMFGSDIIIDDIDVPYKNDPVGIICQCIENQKKYHTVVGIEIVAPVRMMDEISRRSKEFGVPAYRSILKRGPDGAPLTIGKTEGPNPRDILVFERYKML